MEILKDIRNYQNWEVIEPILKGWSLDEKFYICDNKGNKFLLRLSDIDLFEKKKIEHENLILLSKLGFKMSIPIDFGICCSGKKVYSLLTWLEGEDLIDTLPLLTEIKQYELGVEAGKILKKIHSLSPTEILEPWETRYKRKIEIVIKAYKNCGYKIEEDEEIIKYIRSGESYLKNRPITYQHGDFHIGNMILTSDGELGIIDFNRSSYGDPWEEYDRFVFTWEKSTEFANGQLHGYFDNNIPDEFFKLMSLYNARNLIASIPWSIPFGDKELKVAVENIKKTIQAYNGFNNFIPNWYKEAAVYAER